MKVGGNALKYFKLTTTDYFPDLENGRMRGMKFWELCDGYVVSPMTGRRTSASRDFL